MSRGKRLFIQIYFYSSRKYLMWNSNLTIFLFQLTASFEILFKSKTFVIKIKLTECVLAFSKSAGSMITITMTLSQSHTHDCNLRPAIRRSKSVILQHYLPRRMVRCHWSIPRPGLSPDWLLLGLHLTRAGPAAGQMARAERGHARG